MKKILFKGAGSAVPTPFTNDSVNLKEFKNFLQFQIDNDIDALIVCGTTGESATMTKEEKNSGSKAQNSQNKPAQTEQKKDETASKSGKKNKNDAGNIAQIAHMLDGSNNKKK